MKKNNTYTLPFWLLMFSDKPNESHDNYSEKSSELSSCNITRWEFWWTLTWTNPRIGSKSTEDEDDKVTSNNNKIYPSETINKFTAI